MDFFSDTLNDLQQQGLLRHTEAFPVAGPRIPLADGRTLLNFSSNDYLGLAQHALVKSRAMEAMERHGTSASASRLMCGTLELHEQVEAALAELTGRESALLFGSGFGMNTGIIPALAGPDDTLFCDRLIHASLIDGARLSRAEIKRFPHNDCEALARLLAKTQCRGRRIVVTESVFSMDGDIAPLPEIQTLAARHGAMLVVDEAHAIGVFGQGGGFGKGLGATVALGTLGKALASHGGFSVCDSICREYLVNRARSFIYSTALPPASLGAALGALECIAQTPDMGQHLLDKAKLFHQRLVQKGLTLPPFASQIIPVHAGTNAQALELAQRVRARNILAVAVRPPTVPEGSARLRLSVSLAHTLEDLEWAAEEIGDAAREAGLA